MFLMGIFYLGEIDIVLRGPECARFSSFAGFPVKLMDFPRNVLFPESQRFSFFPGFPVKLTGISRN